MDDIGLLDVAHGEFGRRLELVGPADWSRSTPCTEWLVCDLVTHVVTSADVYTSMLVGAPTDVSSYEARMTADTNEAELGRAYRSATHELSEAFRAEGDLCRGVASTGV